MINTEIGLSTAVYSLLVSVFKSFPKVKKVILFGSRAKGDFHSGSDIDLAVKGSDMTYSDMLQLRLAIDELTLLYKVDLLDYTSIDNNDLLEHIERVGTELYSV